LPCFSIVIPAFNPNAKDFSSCLQSIAEQVFSDYEVVVVDDGSDDAGVVSSIVDASPIASLTRVVRTANGGPYAARRRGISVSSGDYIVNMDADDELIGRDALSRISDALEEIYQPDYLLINATRDMRNLAPFCDYAGLAMAGRSLSVTTPREFNALFIDNNGLNSACCKVIKRELFEEIKGELPHIVMADDRYLCLDFLPKATKAGLLNVPLYYYRASVGSTTRSAYKFELYEQVDYVEQRVLEWLDACRYDESDWARGYLGLTSNHLCALCRNPSYSKADLERACESLAMLPSLKRALCFLENLETESFEARQLGLLKDGAYSRFVSITQSHNMKNRVLGLFGAAKARLLR